MIDINSLQQLANFNLHTATQMQCAAAGAIIVFAIQKFITLNPKITWQMQDFFAFMAALIVPAVVGMAAYLTQHDNSIPNGWTFLLDWGFYVSFLAITGYGILNTLGKAISSWGQNHQSQADAHKKTKAPSTPAAAPA